MSIRQLLNKILLFVMMSVVSAVEAAEIIEVKPPVAYPINMVWIYILFGILVAFVFIFLRRLYQSFLQKRSQEKELPPAWKTAFKRLEQLRAQKLIEAGDLKEYYNILCDILREYCEDQFHIKAAEMTTPEFLENIQRSSVFDKDQQVLFRQFLDSCDMVKFAKYAPVANEAEQSFQLAKKIIEVTRPQTKVSPA